MRTIEWRGDHVVLVDQTKLPHTVEWLEVRDVDTMIDAIRRLAVRGAPAIGVAGGFAVALAALEGRGDEHVREAAVRIAAARPTAVNLSWAVRRVLASLPEGTDAVVAAAVELCEEDVRTNRALAVRGAELLEELLGGPARLHTHCNAGGLACVEWGTALGIVRAMHERGSLVSVTADETRPLLQGARLTAFELVEMGVEHRIVVDGAGRVGHRAGARRRRRRRRRSHRRQRRRGEQDRHVPAGPRRGACRHPVRRRRAGVDARPGHGVR